MTARGQFIGVKESCDLRSITTISWIARWTCTSVSGFDLKIKGNELGLEEWSFVNFNSPLL